ncbi:Abi family protein [Actinotignum sp. GS-2025a]|uniref:Abi family protein n=1 Tax=Actinotignum sp. GS-2025a TaxID=3427274 RepID=UPI003F467971
MSYSPDSRVSYYRFSGYFRYWQRDPANGDNTFAQGTSFEKIKRLYEVEEQLIVKCTAVLHPVEVLLRTRFAYAYGHLVTPLGGFARGEGFTQPPDNNAARAEDHALTSLDRSKEPFIAHYRDNIKVGSSNALEAYDRMPIWVAVEGMTFGSLSRLITASGESGVLDEIAKSLSASRRTLPSQVRSFVYLRNRCAHGLKLWNHSVLDVPGLLPNIERRAKKAYGKFSDHSVYKILVALDDLAAKSGIEKDWLTKQINPILEGNQLLNAGIKNPARYGEFDATTFN